MKTGLDRQRGVALVVALVLLVVVTLVGLAAIRGTTMQQQMTSNFYDREIGFQSAEAALRAGEAWAIANTSNTTLIRNCTTQQCIADPFDTGGAAAAQIQSVATGTFDAGALGTGQPQYIVEYLGKFQGPNSGSGGQTANSLQYGGGGGAQASNYYRITARSGDPATVGDRSVVTLQALIQDLIDQQG